jgi:hypothetical protein
VCGRGGAQAWTDKRDLNQNFLGHSQPRLYPWILYLEDSITRNYILQCKFSNIDSHPVLLAYQPPASSIFISEQTSHQQPASSTFLSEQTSTSHQPPAKRTGCLSNIPLGSSTPALLNKRTHHACGQPHGIRTDFILREDLESNLDLVSKFSLLSHH